MFIDELRNLSEQNKDYKFNIWWERTQEKMRKAASTGQKSITEYFLTSDQIEFLGSQQFVITKQTSLTDIDVETILFTIEW